MLAKIKRQVTLKSILYLCSIVLSSLIFTHTVLAQDSPHTAKSSEPVAIGFIGSLSGFAANYGTAALEGAQLAVSELNESRTKVKLTIEDDQSQTKNTVSAYAKVSNVDRVSGVIGGSWWMNAIVKKSEKDNIPLVSCETLFHKDVVKGTNYFILPGYLRDWVQTYEPLVASKKFRTGAIIRYVSGFGATLSESMNEMFSKEGRKFLGSIEYTDINVSDASSVVLQLRKIKPDVVYIDAQPGGIANILRKMRSVGLHKDITILSHSIVYDAFKQGLVNQDLLDNVYFTRREIYRASFEKRFRSKFNKSPYLNADLGYYSVYLMYQALQSKSPIDSLKSDKLSIDGIELSFDKNNVYQGIKQDIWSIDSNGTANKEY